jgi:hypothetical protein
MESKDVRLRRKARHMTKERSGQAKLYRRTDNDLHESERYSAGFGVAPA